MCWSGCENGTKARASAAGEAEMHNTRIGNHLRSGYNASQTHTYPNWQQALPGGKGKVTPSVKENLIYPAQFHPFNSINSRLHYTENKTKILQAGILEAPSQLCQLRTPLLSWAVCWRKALYLDYTQHSDFILARAPAAMATTMSQTLNRGKSGNSMKNPGSCICFNQTWDRNPKTNIEL